MLGLSQQVGRCQLAIAANLVGDDEGLRRTGEQIDADATIMLALGFRDEPVAWSDEDVDWFDRLGPQCHRPDRLNTAQSIDLVGAAHHLGRYDLMCRSAVE